MAAPRTNAPRLAGGALLSLALAGCAAAAPGPVPPARGAVTELRDASGASFGTAELREMDGGHVTVRIEVHGLAPGAHGVHVHTVGRCETPDFATAGGHFDVGGHQHGLDNARGPHGGDLPNLVVGTIAVDSTRAPFSPPQATTHGRLEATLPVPLASLLDADGSALIVHRSADDQRTDPSGNSGPRLLCGAFQPPGGRRVAP